MDRCIERTIELFHMEINFPFYVLSNDKIKPFVAGLLSQGGACVKFYANSFSSQPIRMRV